MDNLHEVLKLLFRARYSFAVWVTGVLLYSASFLLASDQAFYEEHRPYLVSVTLFAFIVWVVEIGLLGNNARQTRNQERARTNELDGFLQTLSAAERDLLARALHRNQQTVVCRGDMHEAWTLVAKGLLLPPSSGETPYCVGFVIPTAVWNLMLARKHEFPKPDK